MMFLNFTKETAEVKRLQKLDDTRATHIKPYDVHLCIHNTGSQVVSLSSGGVPGHTNLPQHPQNLGISSAHNKFTSKA
jgi:hypothetical protein